MLIDDASLQEVKNAIDLLSSLHRSTGSSRYQFINEIEAAVTYAKTYLGIESIDYQKV